MNSQKLKLMLAPKAWKSLELTTRIPALEDFVSLQDGPFIFAGLHRDMIAAILFIKPARPKLLISGSDDGAILVNALSDNAYGFIQGATGENGGRALVKLRKALEAGHHIGLAVDGPKGPFGVIHPGVFLLARMTGATIVPLLPAVQPALVAGTWDRTVVPVLFSKIEMTVGPLMTVPANTTSEEIEIFRQQLSLFFLPESRSVS